MKKIIKYIVVIFLMFFLTGCEFFNREINDTKTTIKGEYKQGKGCGGFVDGVLIKTNCEEYKKYLGKIVEITGVIAESKCTPEFPQCFAGKQMEDFGPIKILY